MFGNFSLFHSQTVNVHYQIKKKDNGGMTNTSETLCLLVEHFLRNLKNVHSVREVTFLHGKAPCFKNVRGTSWFETVKISS